MAGTSCQRSKEGEQNEAVLERFGAEAIYTAANPGRLNSAKVVTERTGRCIDTSKGSTRHYEVSANRPVRTEPPQLLRGGGKPRSRRRPQMPATGPCIQPLPTCLLGS